MVNLDEFLPENNSGQFNDIFIKLSFSHDYFCHFQPEDDIFFEYLNIAAHSYEENMADTAKII